LRGLVHSVRADRLHVVGEYYFEVIHGVTYRAEETGYSRFLHTSPPR